MRLLRILPFVLLLATPKAQAVPLTYEQTRLQLLMPAATMTYTYIASVATFDSWYANDDPNTSVYYYHNFAGQVVVTNSGGNAIVSPGTNFSHAECEVNGGISTIGQLLCVLGYFDNGASIYREDP